MTGDVAFPDISLFWEMNERGVLTIALSGPTSLLRHFASPGEVLSQFLEAVRSRGVDVSNTEQVRVRINKDAGTFLVRWDGAIVMNQYLVYEVLPALSDELGIQSFGAS